jgi:hypothetical protein
MSVVMLQLTSVDVDMAMAICTPVPEFEACARAREFQDVDRFELFIRKMLAPAVRRQLFESYNLCRSTLSGGRGSQYT